MIDALSPVASVFTYTRGRMSTLDDGDEPRAFIVMRTASDTAQVHPLPLSAEFAIGSVGDVKVADAQPEQLVLRWDGHSVNLVRAADGTFVGGKRWEPGELKPGEELSFGNTQLVLGVSVPLAAGGRRSFTHHEFRERLYEELSRAIRGGRSTALVMIAAAPGEGGRIAATALDSFRAGDVVATYASDQPEFLLPDTDAPTARLVAGRILESAGVEAAVGFAVAPDHGESPERILRAAREALQEALREGGGIHAPPHRVPRPVEAITVDARDASTVALIERIGQAAEQGAAVLFVGEKSVGKSAFARLLHARAERLGEFVTVHCAAIDAESADTVFNTRITEAAGGTLFLDEVGELCEEGQAALSSRLDVLDSAHVALIGTTHRALGGLVERGAFDARIWSVLEGHIIEVPSLRSRPEDILPLAERFARESGAAEPIRVSAGAIARLRSYPWPGNVLELRNAMERAVQLAGDGDILADHLPSEPMSITASDGRLREHVDGVERDAIIKALADSNHNQTHSAKRLGISRRALIYKMEKYGLKRPPKSARRA